MLLSYWAVPDGLNPIHLLLVPDVRSPEVPVAPLLVTLAVACCDYTAWVTDQAGASENGCQNLYLIPSQVGGLHADTVAVHVVILLPYRNHCPAVKHTRRQPCQVGSMSTIHQHQACNGIGGHSCLMDGVRKRHKRLLTTCCRLQCEFIAICHSQSLAMAAYSTADVSLACTALLLLSTLVV